MMLQAATSICTLNMLSMVIYWRMWTQALSWNVFESNIAKESLVVNDQKVACITDYGTPALINDHPLTKSNPTFTGRYIAQELVGEDEVCPTLGSTFGRLGWLWGMTRSFLDARRGPSQTLDPH
jgi:hypothetical protein